MTLKTQEKDYLRNAGLRRLLKNVRREWKLIFPLNGQLGKNKEKGLKK